MSEQQQCRVCFYHQDSRYCTHFSLKTIKALLAFTRRQWQFEFREQIGGNPLPQYGRIAAMHNVAIPLPPVVSTALPSQPLPINNLERMRMVAIPVPPSTVPAPNMDRLEQMRNAAIPHPPSSPINNLERMRMAAIPIPPSAVPGYPQQSTSTEVTNSQRQPCTITGEDINQGEEPDHGCTLDFGTPDRGQIQDLLLNAVAGDMPTPDEHQALEQAGVATSDADDNCFPSSNIPYNMDLDRHIMQLVRSQVQHVEAGQYTVDMIDLLEVLWHPHVGYSLEPYTGERTLRVHFGTVPSVVESLLRLPTAIFYRGVALSQEELDHLILVTISWESFSPLLPACYHAYLRCKEDQA
ncbi:hypothetical protein EV401DRAFT_1895292 [Pisolithus croceorrhizus]|nr:hypothetical protein EV401DRAFT_1895292 [Pisolithus croceorrhizus]